MKTKYRLIKCYPGYSNLGIIVSNEDKTTEWKGTYYYDKYPEFWKKVVEKNYQILKLSLQRSIKPDIIDVSDSSESYILALLNCNGNKIHSIKRTSDNVIFTVGDKINRESYKNIDIIRGFNLLEDLCLASISDKVDKGYMSSKGINIVAIEHVKNVLFTTEDGVDIIKPTYCFVVSDNYTISKSNINEFVVKSWYKNRKVFSTQEAAENWIILNKPCLSINDIKQAMKDHFLKIDVFKDIVKSKL